MKTILSHDRSFVPASHEDPRAPGVWKRVLLQRDEMLPGRVQMINWARLPAGSRFARHYHEDMQEIFIFVQGEADMTVNGRPQLLRAGDTIVIEPRETHEMQNAGNEDVEYVVLGIALGQNGKTVVVE